MAFHYDPRIDPEPRLWLALGEQERIAAILAWHVASEAPHPPTPRPTLHAAMHVVAETQAAAGDPPEVRRTLTRLRKAGLDRHSAIHAVASVVGDTMTATMAGGGTFDGEAYAAALKKLKPGDWRF